MVMNCGNCRFLREWECHRNPPECSMAGSRWPMVMLESWCGEWREETLEPAREPVPTRSESTNYNKRRGR